jgi:hypothetical protein
MRILIAAGLLAAAAGCNFSNDSGNDQMTLEYNEQRIRDSANDAARTARDVASGVGNVAGSTGRAIRNEVGDIDVDVDVRRNRERGGNETLGAGNPQNAQ